MLCQSLADLAHRLGSDDGLGAAVVDDVAHLGRGEVGADHRVVQATAPRRPHHRRQMLVVLHEHRDGVAFDQPCLAEVVGQPVGARLKFLARHNGSGRMDDEGRLVGGGVGMLANLHAPTLRRQNLTGVKRVKKPGRAPPQTYDWFSEHSRGRGARMNTAASSGVVTFLFTDIEGSTRRWETDADAMRSALASHDDLLRETVAAHDGWLFKHTGDGVCAAFASPRAAVETAVAAQRNLELPVRMGIGTGEAELRDGDYFGAVLNRSARVMAAGHGGQILLDGVTAGLLTDVDLINLGTRRLRDIAKAVEIFQIRSAGLPTEFPPLKTLDATPGNLRPPATSFVGREAELAELQTVLKGHRLVTLIGVGGVGKTRLALELASLSPDDFPDGVWVIELAAVADPAAVPDAVAAVLGIVQQPGSSLAASVAAALEGRTRLLVFDNCEHVLDAAADIIEAILAASSTVKVIATSREGLRATEEQLWPVHSLDFRSTDTTLFVERASAFALEVSFEDAAAITEICRRLDGIPLAIELAASRMQSMSAIEVRDRLDDRFRLLVGSRRGLERHQ